MLHELYDKGVDEREGEDEAGSGDEEPHRVDVGLAEALQDLVAESKFQHLEKAGSLIVACSTLIRQCLFSNSSSSSSSSSRH